MATSVLLLGVLLAAGSGTSYAGLDAVRKRLTRDLSPLAILLGISIAQLPLHAGLLVLSGWPVVSPLPFLGWVMLAGSLAILANVLLVMAFDRAPLSLVVPMLSFTPAFTLLTGWLLLGQRPSALGVAGMALVVAGALLLDADPTRLLRDPLRTLRSPGSRLALLVAAIFSLGNAIDRRAILHASEPLYALSITAFMAVVVGAMAKPRRELLGARNQFPLLAAGGVIMAAALLLQFFAIRNLPIATVDATKRTAANGVSAVLGHTLFQERDAWRRGLSGLVMSVGVALLVMG